MTARIKGIILIFTIFLTTVTVCISATAKPTTTENIISKKAEANYFLGEFNGKLAIFEADNNAPIEVLDVYIESLPERDVQRIKNGIFADTLSEIIAISEDYEWFFL